MDVAALTHRLPDEIRALRGPDFISLSNKISDQRLARMEFEAALAGKELK